MTKKHHPDDLRMIRLQEGEACAFDEIVAEWQGPLHRFFFRNTRDAQRSEDLVQDTLLRLHRSVWNFIPNGCFRGWLFRIARNLLIDSVRRESSDALLRKVTVAAGRDGESQDLLDLLPDDVVPADVRVSQQELLQIVHELLDTLPEEQRLTFAMHHFDSLSLPEIAVVMQTTLPTAKSRLRLAREKLRYVLTCRGYTEEPVSNSD